MSAKKMFPAASAAGLSVKCSPLASCVRTAFVANTLAPTVYERALAGAFVGLVEALSKSSFAEMKYRTTVPAAYAGICAVYSDPEGAMARELLLDPVIYVSVTAATVRLFVTAAETITGLVESGATGFCAMAPIVGADM